MIKNRNRAIQDRQSFSGDPMNADVLTTRVADGIAVITLGSARRIYFDLLKLCISEPALARMRSYVESNITSSSRSIVVEGD